MNIVIYETTKDEQRALKEKYKGHKIKFFADWVDAKHMPPTDTEILSIHAHSRITAEIIKSLPNLKYVLTRTAGFDHIDLAACKKRGIMASNIPGQNATAVAEFAFGLMLSLARDTYEAISEVKRGIFDDDFHVGRELEGKVLGIAGTGAIGGRVARIAKGFGMQVLAWDVKKNNKLAKELGFRYVEFNRLLEKSDIISLHIPASKENTFIMNKKTLGMMKQGSLLINTARGSLVEPKALYQALESGKLGGAALDVIIEEPAFAAGTISKLPPERKAQAQIMKKIIGMKNVIVTPHMAHASEESLVRIFAGTQQALDAYLEGKPINLLG